MTRMPLTSERAARRRAFTMIELLVVVSIIVVLLSLITGVGYTVIQNQKVSATRGLVSALDRALDEYIQEQQKQNPLGLPMPPPYNLEDYYGVPGPDVSDSTGVFFFRRYPESGGARHPVRPDSAVFLRQAMGHGLVRSIVSGIGANFLRITTTPVGATDPVEASLVDQRDRDADATPSVIDAWADLSWKSLWQVIEDPTDPSIPGFPKSLQQLVFYVHPDNKLAQALYGQCETRRPYFMSAGPDEFYGTWYEEKQVIAHYGLKPSTSPPESPIEFKQRVMKKAREDNVYSYPVKWDFDVDEELTN